MDQNKVHPDLIKMFKFQFTVIFSLIVLMALVPMTIMFGVFGFSSWWPFTGFKTAFFILLCLVIVLPFLFRLIAGILAQKAYDNYSYDLQEEGIDPKLFSAVAFSEYKPVAPNDTSENKQKNRRIEISLLPLEAEKQLIEDTSLIK